MTTALKQGHKRWVAEQRKAAIARVVAYERWLRAGSKLRDIPAIPSNDDYKKAREAGKVAQR